MARPNGAVQIDFTVAAPGTVQPWTDAWQGGLYFDPMLALALARTYRPVLTAACNQPNRPGLQQHQAG